MAMTTAATAGFNISSSAEVKVLCCFLKLERPLRSPLHDDVMAQRRDGGFLWMGEISG